MRLLLNQRLDGLAVQVKSRDDTPTFQHPDRDVRGRCPRAFAVNHLGLRADVTIEARYWRRVQG